MVILNRKSQINNTQIIKRFIRAEQTKKHTTKPVNIPVIFLRPIFLAMFELARFHLTLKSFKLLLKKKDLFRYPDFDRRFDSRKGERMISAAPPLLLVERSARYRFNIFDTRSRCSWLQVAKGICPKRVKKEKKFKITKKRALSIARCV